MAVLLKQHGSAAFGSSGMAFYKVGGAGPFAPKCPMLDPLLGMYVAHLQCILCRQLASMCPGTKFLYGAVPKTLNTLQLVVVPMSYEMVAENVAI